MGGDEKKENRDLFRDAEEKILRQWEEIAAHIESQQVLYAEFLQGFAGLYYRDADESCGSTKQKHGKRDKTEKRQTIFQDK
ncbi:MAG: hypothetical protein ABWK01_06210 [Infirmifilum sp.]